MYGLLCIRQFDASMCFVFSSKSSFNKYAYLHRPLHNTFHNRMKRASDVDNARNTDHDLLGRRRALIQRN